VGAIREVGETGGSRETKGVGGGLGRGVRACESLSFSGMGSRLASGGGDMGALGVTEGDTVDRGFGS